MSIREIRHDTKILQSAIGLGKIQAMTKFGDRLRAWRESKGVTLYKIAKDTGISQPNLTSIEKGRRPASDEVLKKLSEMPEMKISFEQLQYWRMLDDVEALKEKYPQLNEYLDKMPPDEILKTLDEANRITKESK